MYLLTPGPQVDDDALEELYDYPPALTAPFVQVNFVASADGAATVSGGHGVRALAWSVQPC
jgi:hypothetical protein